MDRDTELLRLEQFVEKLLLNFAELKEEKKKLLTKLKERDTLIADLEGNISSKDSERSEISLRVGKLVEQIEDWEIGLDDDEEIYEESLEDEAAVDTSAEEAGAEEDGRVQHNLFSVSGSGE
jgi:chromosome segregation ATPase